MTKKLLTLLFSALCLVDARLVAQIPPTTPTAPMTPPPPATPTNPSASPAVANPPPVNGNPVQQQAPAPQQPGAGVGQQPPAGQPQQAGSAGGVLQPPQPSEVSDVDRGTNGDGNQVAGKWVLAKSLNAVYAILARKSGYGYFRNPSLDSILVTGHMTSENAEENMRDLAVMYGVTLYIKGKTIYALTENQIAALPRKELIYQLKYLRGTKDSDEKRLLDLVGPMLSVNGKIRYEAKTGTLLIVDNDYALGMVKDVLTAIDKPKRQIAIEVKILRINNDNARRVGLDWSGSLGQTGTTVKATLVGNVGKGMATALTTPFIGPSATIISQLFGGTGAAGAASAVSSAVSSSANSTTTPTVGTGSFSGDGIIIDPLTVGVVVRALIENNVATQMSSPRIVTEDNEPAIFGVIDRIPIITQTVSQSNGVNNIATAVRYQIDATDPTDPANSREVGVRIAATPTILPDNTIRLRLLPRVATVVQYIEVPTGFAGISNRYPQVNETTAESIARIPDGYSLILGGYYVEEDHKTNSKVPLLGDIPGISFAFRSSQTERVRSNLVFIITPIAYDASSKVQTVATTERLRQSDLPTKIEAQSADDDHPGETDKPNILRFLRNIFPQKKVKNTNPIHPDNAPDVRLKTAQQIEQEKIRAQLLGSPSPTPTPTGGN